ncbi:cytochrome P450 [Hymenopellis radicata]|nr:cytochrome P450 [Hymenopellis radicata]
MMTTITLAIICLVFVSVLISFALRRRAVTSHIQGPTRPSFWLGHEWVLRHQDDAGGLELQWYRRYGSVVRIAGCFGQTALLVSDAKALEHILQGSPPTAFPKTGDHTRMLQLAFGPGVLSTEGLIHQRQRRVLNPAFSETQLRQLLELFQSSSTELINLLEQKVDSEPTIVNILDWTSRASLEMIGIASFRYAFGAISGAESELLHALHRVIGEMRLYASQLEILYASLWRFLPRSVLRILELFPSKENAHFARFRQTCERVAHSIFTEVLSSTDAEKYTDGVKKDVVGVLAAASTSNDPKKEMQIEEILAQMATFIFAGHDTSAGAVAWVLYELALHPEDQERVRSEVLVASKQKTLAGQKFDATDYDSMPYLNAVIKESLTLLESLRLHPFAHSLPRIAEHDDVLPLAEPIVDVNGKILSEVAIQKGQVLITSLLNYNRSENVWGSDAQLWRPSRFFETEKSINIGVYANLLSFSAGNRSCIGWRYGVMSMQVLTAAFLESFNLEPLDSVEICHAPMQVSSFPAVRGKFQEGPQVPLLLSKRTATG